MDLFSSGRVVTSIALACFVPAGSGTPVHRNRAQHGLAFCFGNRVRYDFSDGTTFSCRPGDCVYLPKGSDYTVSEAVGTGANSGSYAINFEITDEGSFTPFLLSLSGTEEAVSHFRSAERAWRKKGAGYEEDCLSALYAVLALLRKESVRPAEGFVSPTLRPALAYIEERFTEEPIRVPTLASLCGISEQYLRRLFLSSFGVSPAIYLRNRRLAYAKELLSSDEFSISSVAMRAGFEDLSYFSREFRRKYGITPSAFRK